MLGASCGGPCHDGDMVGGEALAGTSASTATARIRARGRRGNGGELTEVRRACSAARGRFWSRRSGDGGLRCWRLKTTAIAAMQRVPGRVGRRSGQRRASGASGHKARARPWRWVRHGERWRGQRSGVVTESEGESEGKNEEVDRIGTAPATSPSASRWQGRGQAGWWRGGTAMRARRPHACPSGARTTTTGTGPVSWAGTEPGQQVAQVSRGKGFPLFVYFLFF